MQGSRQWNYHNVCIRQLIIRYHKSVRQSFTIKGILSCLWILPEEDYKVAFMHDLRHLRNHVLRCKSSCNPISPLPQQRL